MSCLSLQIAAVKMSLTVTCISPCFKLLSYCQSPLAFLYNSVWHLAEGFWWRCVIKPIHILGWFVVIRSDLQFLGDDTISYFPQVIFDGCSLYTVNVATIGTWWLRLAVSNEPNWLGCTVLPNDRSRASFQNVELSNIFISTGKGKCSNNMHQFSSTTVHSCCWLSTMLK
jgi:hypothetical protein